MLVKGYGGVWYTQIDKAMMPKHRGTLEIKILRDPTLESPPPAPTGTTLRQWFAGLALANPELMKDVPESERVAEAVRLADELVGALDVARMPTLDSMAAPSKAELRIWEKKVKIDNAISVSRGRDTAYPPSKPRHRDAHFPAPPVDYKDGYKPDSTSLPPLPPPVSTITSRAIPPEATTYSSVKSRRNNER